MPVTINGDGLIEVGGTSTTQGRVRLAEDTDNGSNYVELTAPASVTANRTVTFPDANVDFSTGLGVAQGGTGATSLTANNVLLGNGTSAVQVVAPGASGNLLTSNGTTWTSAAPASSFVGFRGQAFTSNGTFTIPTGITAVKVTVVGGGGGGGGFSSCAVYGVQGGGGGGAAISYLTGLTPGNTLAVTVGSGGTAGSSGGGSGGSGGSSSVASGTQSISTITANGGGGATGNNTVNLPGAGGTASGGTINMPGGGGGMGSINGSGNGGASILGGGGRGMSVSSTSGGSNLNGGGYGGGGGGAAGAGSGTAGGAGAAGVVIFEW